MADPRRGPLMSHGKGRQDGDTNDGFVYVIGAM